MKPQPLLECPSIEFEAPARQKPLAAMGVGQVFPQVPSEFREWPGERQAEWVVKNWRIAAESFSACETNRKSLIDWIND